MPRYEITELDHSFKDDRWTYFGPWLRWRRLMAGLTQDEIATLVAVSRRQWIRYEQGSKMLRKRIKRIAAALNVPEQNMLDRAGYKVSRRRNDVDRLSAEFFNLLLNVMTESKEDKLKEAIMHPRDRNRFRDRCIEALQSSQFRIHTFQTNPSITYEIS